MTEIIKKAFDDLNNIKDSIISITEAAIKTAMDTINSVINEALDAVRKVAEDAIDAGINITECYVNCVDRLNIIRRELLLDEVKCATGQLDAFNLIIDGAVKNFTDDLTLIGELPGRLKDCVTSLDAIICISRLVSDVAKFQQDIPRQILGTLTEITEYFTTFQQRLHQCQFDQLRIAVNKSRDILDDIKLCARNPFQYQNPLYS